MVDCLDAVGSAGALPLVGGLGGSRFLDEGGGVLARGLSALVCGSVLASRLGPAFGLLAPLGLGARGISIGARVFFSASLFALAPLGWGCATFRCDFPA